MEERRKFPRLNYNVEVKWTKIQENQKRESRRDVTKNISGGGICLMVDDSVKEQDTLALNILLPIRETIFSKGVVRWVESFSIDGEEGQSRYEAGIEFTEISDQDREKIKQFVFSILGKNK